MRNTNGVIFNPAKQRGLFAPTLFTEENALLLYQLQIIHLLVSCDHTDDVGGFG